MSIQSNLRKVVGTINSSVINTLTLALQVTDGTIEDKRKRNPILGYTKNQNLLILQGNGKSVIPKMDTISPTQGFGWMGGPMELIKEKQRWAGGGGSVAIALKLQVILFSTSNIDEKNFYTVWEL